MDFSQSPVKDSTDSSRACAEMEETTNGSMHEETLSSSSMMSTSLGSISSPRRSNHEFSKAYKQASNFFLTRRFSEAVATVKPLITAPENEEQSDEEKDEARHTRRAPIAKADRKWRVKVWSFYVSLLNAIAEMEPEDGKAAFGNKEWRSLVAKAEDGSIWEEVVNTGYGGNEGNVDPDVVVNLARLLLARSPSQTVNQQHLETYLSASSQPNVNGDTKTSQHHKTDTLRDLEITIQVIELYALHVLPHNGEWGYARDFISLAEVLDEEQREAFHQALTGLQEESSSPQDQDYEDAVLQQTEESNWLPLSIDRADSTTTVIAHPSPIHRRADSEKDYGIEDAEPEPILNSPVVKPSTPKPARKPSHSLHPNSSRPPPAKSTHSPSNTGVFKRSLATISALQNFISKIAQQLSQNPMSLLRFVLFLLGLVAALSRRDVKDRLGRLTGAGWDKVKKTIGMGVKVSYI